MRMNGLCSLVTVNCRKGIQIKSHMDKGVGMDCRTRRFPNSVSENEMDGSFSDGPMLNSLNSSTFEPSDDEISTKKENHPRLGPEDLNDTILYDF